MRVLAFAIAVIGGATAGYAEEAAPLQGDVTGFEACFIQLLLDNPSNPMLEMMGPIVCGERHIPMGQTCDALDYMLFERRSACKPDDLVFWQAQVEARAAAAIEDGRAGVGALYVTGLEHCHEEIEDGLERLDCEIEINWRTSMEFMAADLVAELVGETQ